MNTIHKDVRYTTKGYQSHLDKQALQAAIASFVGLSMPWYYTDCLGQLLGMNRHFCEWVGLSKKAVATATLDMFYTDDARKKIFESQQQVIVNHTTVSTQETLIHTDNKPLFVQSTQMPLHDTQQHVIAIMHLFAPLADKSPHQSDNGTQELFQHLQDIAETIPAPFYWLDLNHRLLGANNLTMQAIGAKANDLSLIGKTAADIYPKDIADTLVNNQLHIIKTNKPLTTLETIKDIYTGEVRHYKVTIAPLHGNNKQIVGTYGISIDITHEKETQQLEGREKVFQHLKNIAETIPVPFYWLDTRCRSLGMNTLALNTMGFKGSKEDIIGKGNYDLYPKKMADKLTKNQKEVINENKTLTKIETIQDRTTGAIKYYEATIAPLHDDDGTIIGTYGVSIDITAQKEAEQLRLTHEVHQAKLAEQERFMAFISKAVHDLGSPLAVLKMLLNACHELEANKRRGLNDAVDNINAIANDLLVQWAPNAEQANKDGAQAQQPMLIALVLLEALAAKRIEYNNAGLTFDHDFTQESYFSCITGDVFAFKRSISNIINNAVGAYDEASTSSARSTSAGSACDKKGVIRCHLMLEDSQVVVQLQDEGKGIPPDILDKLRKAVSVTSGKKGGHGIGMTQVRDTVETFGGALSMDSTVGQGTTIELHFPQLPTVEWLAHDITLNADDTVVVLDDVESIHEAWKTRFQQSGLTDYLQQHTVHFTQGQEAVDYLQAIEDKSTVFLLSDYELHHQKINGIDVLEKTGIQRAVLATSHYAKEEVQAFAAKTGIKILPKPLAAEIPIHFDVVPVEDQRTQQEEVADALVPNHKQVDLVMVDDDVSFASTLVFALESEDKVVDLYQRPQAFLDKLNHYSKETKISLDYHLSESIDGLQLAEQLYQAGYKNLYLLSGRKAHEFSLPSYITFVSKGDIIQKTPLELFWPEEG